MDIDAERSFGDLLRSARCRAGLTQRQLAERSGVSLRAVSDLERGINRAPRRETLRLLADALDLPPADRHDWETTALSPLRDQRTATTAHSVRQQLPIPSTSFIGRDEEIRQAVAVLSQPEVRLLTLTGPGGVGKTRLALAVAERSEPSFPEGVFVVNLAPLTDPALVMPTIVQALRVRVAGMQSSQEAMAAWLRGRRILVVLDNVEHLLAAAPEIASLLDMSYGLTILATSRAPLRVQAEREVAVSPLAVPAGGRVLRARDVDGASAVRLFVDRAQAVRVDFRLTDQNAAVVTAICSRLGGLPLAIELAAARLQLLAPSELLARLNSSLPLLVDGPRDVPERQRTLRDTIAWSYRLLSEADQRMLRQLTIFAGGWTLESALAVCDTSLDVMAGLSALIDHSLVHARVQPDGDYRYMMLETIREFGSELLTPPEIDSLAARLRDFVLESAKAAGTGLGGARPVDWIVRHKDDIANIRSTIAHALDRGEKDIALQLLMATVDFWVMLGLHHECRDWMRRALDSDGNVSALMLAEALMHFGGFSYTVSDYESADIALTRAIDLYRQSGNVPGVGWAMNLLGWSAMLAGRYEEAMEIFQQGLELARTIDDQFLLADASVARALIGCCFEDWDLAEKLVVEALAIYRDANDSSTVSHLLHGLAYVALWQGDADRAASWSAESLDLVNETDWATISNAYQCCGDVSLDLGRLTEAGSYFRDALRFCDPEHEVIQFAECLEGLAGVAAGLNDLARAARLLGAMAIRRERINTPIPLPNRWRVERYVARVRDELSAEEWSRACRESRMLTDIEAYALAMEPERVEIDVAQPVSSAITAGLSPRETEVLRLVVDGRSDREIADQLFISRHTVAHHVTSILNKLGVSSRTAAATHAVRKGLV